ncbi:glyoxalase [Aureimonas sp. SA4125]|uniref:VOC family protein n=1 Tax=Aureimonas sp. SA4125 TaxID=2826993 RepID=UPI001CC5588F|nr:VOC family protein [Aureimonas sp. SA4125]BDA83462.1 glyoxalase [Aureimonas sp. SA4125]
MTGSFCWYELVTSDAAAAEAFYAKVTGWTMRDSGQATPRYTLASAAGSDVAGIMARPCEDVPPMWLGYVAVPDVDASAASFVSAGGAIEKPPADIPGIGRFAVVTDPEGVRVTVFATRQDPPAPVAPGTPGHFAWHELNARDGTAAFDFYNRQFGWQKSMAMDMGPMGVYQLVSDGEKDIGAMMTNAAAPAPFWLYYIQVESIEAASLRLTEAGGTIANGPHEVPGDNWIVQAIDPQGAMFAMVGPRQ